MDVINFANRIKTERNNQNMSQKRLAELIGIDNTALSRIENGKTDITVVELLKIAEVLNVPIEYLLLDFIPGNNSDSEGLLRQIEKLDPGQRKTLIDVIMILTQNNERWRTITTDTGQYNSASTENNKSVDYTEIGQRIRSQRLRTQLSQERLAELAGISTSFLGSIERGEEILSIETLFKIANALRQPVGSLLLNANTDDTVLGLCDAVEELARSDNNKSVLLLNMLMTLIDNSDKW